MPCGICGEHLNEGLRLLTGPEEAGKKERKRKREKDERTQGYVAERNAGKSVTGVVSSGRGVLLFIYSAHTEESFVKDSFNIPGIFT